jgi:hypothetical protein
MEQKAQNANTAGLIRVIEKNQQYLDAMAEDLKKKLAGGAPLEQVPAAILREALAVYENMRTRLLEIGAVEQLLARKQNRPAAQDPARQKLIAELDSQIGLISGRLPKRTSAPGGAPEPAGTSGPRRATPSEQWLRTEEDSVAFTRNVRLLDELDYAPVGPPPPGTAAAPDSRRVVEPSGRGFTLFSVRGPAAALDALHPQIRFREHDIIERFSAGEIRGVLTHLRQVLTEDVVNIFRRLITSRFSEAVCILVRLQSPDHLGGHLLQYLDRMAEEMRPGQIRSVIIQDHDRPEQTLTPAAAACRTP